MQLRERARLWTTAVVIGTVGLGVGCAWFAELSAPWWAWLAWAAGSLVLAHGGLAVWIGEVAEQPEVLRQHLGSQSTSSCLEEAAGPDLRRLGASIDTAIAEHRAVEAALRDQLRPMTEAVQRSPHGVLITDASGRITFANRLLRTMLPLRNEPVGGLPLETVPVVEVHDAVNAGLLGETVTGIALSTAHHDFELTSQILHDGQVLLRVIDATEVRQAERSRADFVANVSHELRTPITALMGYAEALRMDAGALPADALMMVQTLERNAKRLRDLFEDLLKLHRIEVRRRELPLRRQPLEPLVLKGTAAARDQAVERGLSFEVICEPSLAARVNPEALHTILGNLATNAVRYTPAPGHVRVSARSVDGQPYIEVADDGIGIHESHHERIWERFYRVDDARSRQLGGTGLGLAIVKHFALACRCSLELQSAEGTGSRFRVVLPT